jgi:preprotein translocase subunit SecD
VQLPGVTDVEQAKRVISTPALQLRAGRGQREHARVLLEKTRARSPTTWTSCRARDASRAPEFYLVRKEAVITGRDLKNARAG